MLRPNVCCTIERLAGHDLYGGRALSKPQTTQCAVVKLLSAREASTVRADSSASRGGARQIQADARLLFPTSVALDEGDRVTVSGIRLHVKSIRPRFDAFGAHHHNEVDLDIWASV